MTKRLDILLLSALCLLLAVTAGSCAQNELDVPDGPEPTASGSMVTLKFKIHADNATPGTRSGLGQWEEESATVAERILNPKDIRVLILDSSGNLIKSVRPSVLNYTEGTPEPTTGVSGDGYYDLTVYFEDDTFEKFFEKNGDDAKFKFRVMIFANMNSIGSNYITDNYSPGAIITNLQEVFTMQSDWYPSDNQGIPMYGYKSPIEATKKELTADRGFDVGDIYLLRALCKVEVSDEAQGTVIDGVEYPRVSGVDIISWRDKGNIRPLYEGYESGLTIAYIPETAKIIEGQPLQARLVGQNEKGKDVYRIYCPEAKLADVTIRVYVQTAPGQPRNEQESHVVNLGKYADRNDNPNRIFGDDLVRNHIYRFAVRSIRPKADIELDVLRWTKVEYTHKDYIEMAEGGSLKWDVEGKSDFSVNYTDNMLSMLNSTEDYVTGTFHIVSPQNCIWRAYLIPGENGVDAFEFVDVDADGNVTGTHSYVEGKVGEPATIHLRGKGKADAYRHYAELVVVVRQPDGSVLYAPITDGSDGSDRFTIYREDKL